MPPSHRAIGTLQTIRKVKTSPRELSSRAPERTNAVGNSAARDGCATAWSRANASKLGRASIRVLGEASAGTTWPITSSVALSFLTLRRASRHRASRRSWMVRRKCGSTRRRESRLRSTLRLLSSKTSWLSSNS